jgi:hypothetical protein
VYDTPNECDGGLIAILGSGSAVVSFENVTIWNIKIASTANGAISISGVLKLLYINDSKFDLIRTGDNGGAIYLSVSNLLNKVDSIINNSVFTSCSANKGGAIYIDSSGIKLRNLQYFLNDGDDGSDIYENSDISNSYYKSESDIESCSFSSGTRFSLSDGENRNDLLPDCVDADCHFFSCADHFFISPEGEDSSFCGNESRVCRTVDYVLKSSNLVVGTLTIVNGTNGFGSVNNSKNNGFNLTFEGLIEPDENVKAIIHPSSTITTDAWISLSGNSGLLVTIVNLGILYPSDFGGFLFSVSYTPNKINITGCSISSNSSYIEKCLVRATGGTVFIFNTHLHDINFSECGVFYENGTSPNKKHIFDSCRFDSINSVGSHPILFDITFKMYANLTNNTFINVTAEDGVVIKISVYDNVLLSNNSFANISSFGACLSINITINFSISDLSMTNMTSKTHGGAIYVPNLASINYLSVIRCNFTNCKTEGNYFGGMELCN